MADEAQVPSPGVKTIKTRRRTRHLRPAEARAAREQFLAQLRLGWSVSKAADVAKCGRPTAYHWREVDAEFRKAWDDAYTAGGDLLEDEARRRAVDGWDEPVFQGGDQVGVVHRYSDRLLERLLKGRKPELYGEQVSVVNQSEPVEIIVRYVDHDPINAASRVRVVTAEGNGSASAPPALPAPKLPPREPA